MQRQMPVTAGAHVQPAHIGEVGIPRRAQRGGLLGVRRHVWRIGQQQGVAREAQMHGVGRQPRPAVYRLALAGTAQRAERCPLVEPEQ